MPEPIVPDAKSGDNPPKEKVITPDWSKLIDRLSLDIEEAKKDREAWKVKALALDKEIADLKALAVKFSAPPDIRQSIGAFAPWDLFFGE